MDNDITQKAPAALERPAHRAPIEVLADSLADVQAASGQMLEAMQRHSVTDVQVAAQDAVSAWLVAKAAFQRIAIRAQVDPASHDEERRSAKQALDCAYWTLDDRLAVAGVSMQDHAARDVLKQLAHSLALASDVLVPDDLPRRPRVQPAVSCGSAEGAGDDYPR